MVLTKLNGYRCWCLYYRCAWGRNGQVGNNVARYQDIAENRVVKMNWYKQVNNNSKRCSSRNMVIRFVGVSSCCACGRWERRHGGNTMYCPCVSALIGSYFSRSFTNSWSCTDGRGQSASFACRRVNACNNVNCRFVV